MGSAIFSSDGKSQTPGFQGVGNIMSTACNLVPDFSGGWFSTDDVEGLPLFLSSDIESDMMGSTWLGRRGIPRRWIGAGPGRGSGGASSILACNLPPFCRLHELTIFIGKCSANYDSGRWVPAISAPVVRK